MTTQKSAAAPSTIEICSWRLEVIGAKSALAPLRAGLEFCRGSAAPGIMVIISIFQFSVLQCVVVCCSVLQCVAVWNSVLQCVAVCCGVMRCVAMCCSVPDIASSSCQ